jgi:ABC-type multidrug transport system permease subunit
MNSLLPKSTTGLVLVVIYVGFALYAIHDDRTSQGGGFLRGLVSRLMVAPVSMLVESVGSSVSYRSNLQMGVSVLLTAVLVYWIGFGLGKGAHALFSHFVR